MIGHTRCGVVVVLSIIALVHAAPAAISVSFVPAAQWGQPDEAIGLAGGIVEDFEDVFLAPGLTFEISDVDGAFSGVGVSVLSNVFDPVDGDPFGDTFAEGVWDGSHVLVNTESNESIYYGSQDWRPLAFRIPDGTAWIAMAAQQVTVNHMLYVNELPVGRLLALGFELGPGRNGVMIVSSDDAVDPVVSVRFGGRGDAFVIDHVVFAEPGLVAGERMSWGSVKSLFAP